MTHVFTRVPESPNAFVPDCHGICICCFASSIRGLRQVLLWFFYLGTKREVIIEVTDNLDKRLNLPKSHFRFAGSRREAFREDSLGRAT